MGRFTDAEREFRLALKSARAMDSQLLETRIVTNIASVQFLQGTLRKADATATAGITKAVGAAAEWRPFLFGVRAQIAFAEGNSANAARLIERTFAGVDPATSIMPFRDFHATAYQIYEARGEFANALAHLRAFKRLDDDGRDVAASANAALNGARFDAANQDLRISELKAERIEGELRLARSNDRLRGLVQFGTLIAAAAAAVIAAILFALRASRRSRKEMAAANAVLRHVSHYDMLTGLANRILFRLSVEEAIAAVQNGGSSGAVLLIDLDRFKAVNDMMGHSIGDALLCDVSRRLETIAGNMNLPARLGGDEFAIVVSDVESSEALQRLADTVVTELSRPYSIGGSTVMIGATVGYASVPADGQTPDMLTHSADLALYYGKGSGRGLAVRYLPSMQADADERQTLERDLRTAVQQGHLEIAYQSIVNAETRRIIGREALLRWQHPTRGDIPPAVFVPIAEEAGFIGQISAWVLRIACAEAATWPDDIKLAVNVSALQVEGPGLVTTVVSALAASGLVPSRLELELTESVLFRHNSVTDITLKSLRDMGVELVLDDFGTGYSSLSYLHRTPFSTIKIDRSFVKSAAAGNRDSKLIIGAIITLAKGLGLETTAEGIETESEMRAMRKIGCSQLQGYLFSKPTVPTRRVTAERLTHFPAPSATPDRAVDVQPSPHKRRALR